MPIHEHPILFSGPMVRAIIDGSKTETRRTIFPQPKVVYAIYPDDSLDANCIRGGYQRISCPCGRVGDHLWVRESWKYRGWSSYDNGNKNFATFEYTADGARRDVKFSSFQELMLNVPKQNINLLEVELSDDESRDQEYRELCEKWFDKTRPSIHMPRIASRIILEVKDIKFEYVQDITEEGARAEGVANREEFISLWNSINEKRGHSWEMNPYVWVIKFKVIEHKV